jgi:hypothetical protein
LVSLRKRPQTNYKDEPVRTSPVTLDVPKLAEPGDAKAPSTNGAADASPPPELRDPGKEASRNAIQLQLRLKEMEAADQRQAASQQQPQQRPEVEETQQQQAPSAEQIIEGSGLPDNAKSWLRAHPDYITDPTKNAQLRKMHTVAEWQSGGQQYTDLYFDKMNVLLGLKQEARHVAPAPSAAPLKRQYGGPVSAPPSRQSLSMTSGRPIERQPRLSDAELEIAQNSGISPEEYQKQKSRWEQIKRSPGFDDGRGR